MNVLSQRSKSTQFDVCNELHELNA